MQSVPEAFSGLSESERASLLTTPARQHVRHDTSPAPAGAATGAAESPPPLSARSLDWKTSPAQQSEEASELLEAEQAAEGERCCCQRRRRKRVGALATEKELPLVLTSVSTPIGGRGKLAPIEVLCFEEWSTLFTAERYNALRPWAPPPTSLRRASRCCGGLVMSGPRRYVALRWPTTVGRS